ncbi:MAG TPA: N-acetylmuramic acid 6-phosphate etherase, partial [Bacteroidetes bacterium]|nr:N-acetylmuramic acid 6-phosphate etherase [Bacteroidota bacterium]
MNLPGSELRALRAAVEELEALGTEQPNPASEELDRLPTLEILRLIHEQDHGVPEAVGRALEAIAEVVEAAAGAISGGGRLVYVGAGTSGRLGVLDAAECPPTYGVPADWVVGIIAGGDTALRTALEGAEDDVEQ